MKTYQDFMLECSQLEESSLSRIKSKSDKGGMAILSGSRGDKSSKENKARAKQLDRDIRGKGLLVLLRYLEDGMRKTRRLVKPKRLKNAVTLSPLAKWVRGNLRKL